MKKIFISIFFFMSLIGWSQNEDPILMTINGKPVYRSEFEYSYNKNGNIEGALEKKTVDEYAEMFVNYKLKVAVAEAAHLDTLSSFKEEFMQYRDMQLIPQLIDTTYIDSIAQSIYTRTANQLEGKDLLRLAHILILIKQNASEKDRQQPKTKIDSLYQRLKEGGNFTDLAQRHSEDRGTASRGGELPWIGPNMTLKEFEEAAYSLNVGEMSSPIQSSVGFHIIKMLERKQLEPYEVLKPEIYASLKRQNIEELSAEHHIQKLITASGEKLTRSAILDSILQIQQTRQPDLKYLIQEYHDGLLLYEISKRLIWDIAANDEKGLAATFKANKKNYIWTEPHFKGFVIRSKNNNLIKKVNSFIKKNSNNPDWRRLLKQTFNKDSVTVSVSGPYLVKKGENAYIDQCVFGGESVPTKTDFKYVGVSGKKINKPQNFLDVKQQVLADYQEQLEQVWIEKLRKEYTFTINRDILSTVNKH